MSLDLAKAFLEELEKEITRLKQEKLQVLKALSGR